MILLLAFGVPAGLVRLASAIVLNVPKRNS
jgi:hypothetical protein